MPSNLVDLRPLVAPDIDEIDLWLYDYQYAIVRSLMTGAEQRPSALVNGVVEAAR